MFKKVFAVVVCFLILILPSISSAQNDSTQTSFPVIDISTLPMPQGTPPGIKPEAYGSNNNGTTTESTVMTSPLYIGEVRIDKDTYNAGDTVKGTIYVSNKQQKDMLDVYFDISLAGKYSTTTNTFSAIPQNIYNRKVFGPYLVKGISTTKIPFSYVLPQNIGGKNLGINVAVREKNGLVYYQNNAFIKEVIGGVKLLEVKQVYIEVDGKKYQSGAGPTIYASSSSAFHFTVFNPTNTSVSVKPSISIHDRITTGDLIKKVEEKEVSISKNGNHDFVIDVPKSGIPPGVYAANIDLVDSKNFSRIQNLEFRYIIPGASAVIHGVSFSAKSVNEGDNIDIEVGYSGPAMDINRGVDQKIEGAVVKLEVYNGSTNELIGSDEAPADFSRSISSTKLSPKINNSSETIKVVAQIIKDDNVLAKYESSVTTPDLTQIKKVNPNTYPWKKIAVAIILIILIMLFLVFMKNAKMDNKIKLSILIALSLVGGSSLNLIRVEAQGLGYENTLFNPWGTIGAYTPVFTNPTRQYLTVGEWIYFGGYYGDYRCFNKPEQAGVYISLKNSSGNMFRPNPTPYIEGTRAYYSEDFWDSHYTAYEYHWFSGWFDTAGIPVGTYYLTSFFANRFGSNGNFNNATGILNRRDRVPVYIYNPVSVSCTANKTTASVNEPVTWTMTISGGTGVAWTYWSGTDEPYVAPKGNIRTLTKTYTTPGLKTMATAAVDYYTQNNSATNNGGPWNICGGGVTITSTPTTGSVRITRIGSDGLTTSAPSGTSAKVGTLTPSTINPAVYNNLAVNTYTAYATDLPGYTETMGTCTYTGTNECNLITLSLSTPTCYTAGNNAGLCSISAPVTAGTTTKVVVMYVANNSTNLTTPTGLTASTGSTCGSPITLNWNSVAGATGYRLYRSDISGVYSEITPIQGTTATTFSDTPPLPNTNYYYKVSAFNTTSSSALSTPAVPATSQSVCPNTGHLRISRYDEGGNPSSLSTAALVPLSGAPTFTSTNPADYTGLNPEVRSVQVLKVTGYTTKFGTCRYSGLPTGGTCNVNLSTSVLATCSGSICTIPAEIFAGETNKVAVFYVPTGGGTPSSCTGTREYIGPDNTCLVCPNYKNWNATTQICACPDGTIDNTTSHSCDPANTASIITFRPVPDTVNRNTPCSLQLTAEGVNTCTINGGGNSFSITSDSATKYINTDPKITTSPIPQTTRFTATCTSASGGTDVTKNATCTVNGDIIEQ